MEHQGADWVEVDIFAEKRVVAEIEIDIGYARLNTGKLLEEFMVGLAVTQNALCVVIVVTQGCLKEGRDSRVNVYCRE